MIQIRSRPDVEQGVVGRNWVDQVLFSDCRFLTGQVNFFKVYLKDFNSRTPVDGKKYDSVEIFLSLVRMIFFVLIKKGKG